MDIGTPEGTLVFLKLRDGDNKEWLATATVFFVHDENGVTKRFEDMARELRLTEFKVVTDD